MVTSWNKLCFTTGYIEMSISMPGSAQVPGLWPAAWTMGNLVCISTPRVVILIVGHREEPVMEQRQKVSMYIICQFLILILMSSCQACGPTVMTPAT
jgi:hypothetical protein